VLSELLPQRLEVAEVTADKQALEEDIIPCLMVLADQVEDGLVAGVDRVTAATVGLIVPKDGDGRAPDGCW
jgi:hypothetical protein